MGCKNASVEESSTLEGKHPHEQRRMKWKRKYWLAGICNTLNSHHPVHQKEVKNFQKKKVQIHGVIDTRRSRIPSALWRSLWQVLKEPMLNVSAVLSSKSAD